MTMIDVRYADRFRRRADRVAGIATQHAGAVHQEARFPRRGDRGRTAEGIARHGCARELGGGGADIAAVMDVCYRLGRGCSPTAIWCASSSIAGQRVAS